MPDHRSSYADNMFQIDIEKETYALKVGHILDETSCDT